MGGHGGGKTAWVVIFLLLGITVLPLIVLAVDAPSPNIVSENSQFFAWMFGVALTGLGVLIAWFIKSGNENNVRQWDQLNNHERRLSHLEGEHKVNHKGDK